MPQKLNGLFTELTRKKAYYEDQIKKIDAVLTSLRGIDGYTRRADPSVGKRNYAIKDKVHAR